MLATTAVEFTTCPHQLLPTLPSSSSSSSSIISACNNGNQYHDHIDVSRQQHEQLLVVPLLVEEEDEEDIRTKSATTPTTQVNIQLPQELIQEILSFMCIRLSSHIIPTKYDFTRPNAVLSGEELKSFQHDFMRLMFGKMNSNRATGTGHQPFLLYCHLDVTRFFKHYRNVIRLRDLKSLVNCNTLSFDGQLSTILQYCPQVTKVNKWVLNEECLDHLTCLNSCILSSSSSSSSSSSPNNNHNPKSLRKWQKLTFSSTGGDSAFFRRVITHFLFHGHIEYADGEQEAEEVKGNEYQGKAMNTCPSQGRKITGTVCSRSLLKEEDFQPFSQLKVLKSTTSSGSIHNILKLLKHNCVPILENLAVSLPFDNQVLDHLLLIVTQLPRLRKLNLILDVKFHDRHVLECNSDILSQFPETLASLESLQLFNFSASNINLIETIIKRSPRLKSVKIADFHNCSNMPHYLNHLVQLIQQAPRVTKWNLRGEVANELLVGEIVKNLNVKSISLRTHCPGLVNHNILSLILSSHLKLDKLYFAGLTYQYPPGVTMDWESLQVNCCIQNMTLFPNIDMHRIELVTRICHRLKLKGFEIIDHYAESTHAHQTASMKEKLRVMVQRLLRQPTLEYLSYSLMSPSVALFSELAFNRNIKHLKLNGKFFSISEANQVIDLFNSCPSLQLVTFIKMKREYLKLWRQRANFDVQVLNLKK